MAEEVLSPLHAIMVASANLLGVATVIAHSAWRSRRSVNHDRRTPNGDVRMLKQYLFGVNGEDGLGSTVRRLVDNQKEIVSRLEKMDARFDTMERALLRFVAATCPDKMDHLDFDSP